MSKETFRRWICAAGVRAGKTAAQTAVTLIGTVSVSIASLDWLQILGISATAAVVSLLTSVAGLPEVDDGASPLKKA